MCQSARRGGARAVGVDHDEPRAVAPRLLDHGPEMDVVAVDVRAPGQDQLRKAEVFGRRAKFFAVDQVPCLPARLGTDGAVELAGAQAVKEAPVHGAVAEHADGSRVAVRQNGFGAIAIADLLEPRGDRVQRFIPADALECFVLAAALQRPFARRVCASGEENPVGRVDAVKILGHFAAEKALSHRLRWIAFDFHGASLARSPSPAPRRSRAVVRADGVNDAEVGRGMASF